MKVSVVIPTYNRADMIEDAIASVLAQECELIVYDDGSTDSTPSLASRTDLTYVSGEHQGMTPAFNRAVESADCDLVAFLGSDDMYAPDKIARQVSAIGDADCCFTGLSYIPRGTRRWHAAKQGMYGAEKHIRIQDYDTSRFRTFQGNVHTGTALVRRDRWIPWHEEIVTGGADLLWVFEMACRDYEFAYVPECCYIVGQHDGRQIAKRRAMDQAEVVRELQDVYWPLVAEIGASMDVLTGAKGYR